MIKRKYRVYGHTTVTVVIDVFADNEEDAKETAYAQRDSLTAYCGNGGVDKLIGVDNDEESVITDSDIDYDDAEYIGLFDEDEDEDDDEEAFNNAAE